ncbi:MAG: riboflavin synthase [Anaerovoracaceae bacterium]
MFTGIIEEIGIIQAVQHGPASSLLTIQAAKVLEDVKDGDSIAVNGVCLTVTSHGSSYFTADVMHETLNRSSLGNLRQGSPVNLERAMAAGGRFGGHIVSGHIDGTGTIAAIRQDDIAVWYTINASPAILRYIIEKGSITIDGISLTVAAVTRRDFSVSIIPHTAAQTTLSRRKAGDMVNLENDIIGKYVEKLLQPAEIRPKKDTSSITMDFIETYGF